MTKQRMYKGIQMKANQIEVAKNIDLLAELTDQLRDLQASWNNLGLLGELTNIGADITQTREHFEKLAGTLCHQLIELSVQRVTLDLSSKAQNTIDILVRNLFERTADIGFLSTDTELTRSAAEFEPTNEELISTTRGRMYDYVDKYSVYDNILLLDPQGYLLLDMADEYEHGKDLSAFKEQIDQAQEYAELFGRIDSTLDNRNSLLYGWKLTKDDRICGYVILRFNLGVESKALFTRILPTAASDDEGENWVVCGAVDENGVVVFSSDVSTLAEGVKLNLTNEDSWCTARIGPMNYLACARKTNGYEGYMGPGWRGFALAPISQAFATNVKEEDSGEYDIDWSMTEGLLSPEILRIQYQSASIQKQLNRSVWNGNISQRNAKQNLGHSFTKTLLWEISKAGEETRSLIASYIDELLQTITHCLYEEQRFAAMLAIDLMDRNLYERANDCRWWALTEAYEKALSQSASEDDIQNAKESLVYTNSLYTVYTDILLIAADGNVMCNSGEKNRAREKITTSWFKEALTLRDQNQYAVSGHEPTELYDRKPTYVYCAPVYDDRHKPSRAIGAIAVVFDGIPQFEAILNESIGHDRDYHAYIVNSELQVISSTSDAFVESGKLMFPVYSTVDEFKRGRANSHLVEKDGVVYGLGTCNSDSYREYKANGTRYQNELTAVFLTRIGPEMDSALESAEQILDMGKKRDENEACLEIATFKIGHTWFGIECDYIDGAVELPNLASVPNSEAWILGTMILNGEAISVISLHSLLGQEQVEITDTANQQVVLIQTGVEKQRFGLHVNDLGSIPNIPMSQLHDTKDISSHDGLVGTIAKSGDRLLSILNYDYLAGMINATESTQ